MSKLQKFSLTQLGWENPCCLRHPILQNNESEKFVYFASEVEELKQTCDELAEALAELLKGGKHEGQCDNIDLPEESCDLHWETYESRSKKAEQALARYYEKFRER